MVRRKVNGCWKHVKAQTSSNNRVKTIPGDGGFNLRYRMNGEDAWEPVGDSPDEALAAKRRREIALEAIPGVSVAGVTAELQKQGNSQRKIDEAIEQYLADTRAQKEPRTFAAYKIAVTQFRESCTKMCLEELERRDLLNFTAFLRKGRKRNGELLSDRTIYNRFENVITFLKEYGLRGLVLHKDWPTYEEEDAVPYTVEELGLLFAAMDIEQFVWCQFFLKTGARDKEVVFAAWTDIDFESKIFSVTHKKDLGFKPKNHEARRIPIPDDLIEMLRERRKVNPNDRLIFTNRHGGPERKFLKKLKHLAWRAGLNCTHCTTVSEGKTVCCKDKPVCKKWILHRFRKTFATLHHEAGVSLRTLQNWLGHKSLETTIRYLGIAEARSERTREQVNKSFKVLTPKLEAVA